MTAAGGTGRQPLPQVTFMTDPSPAAGQPIAAGKSSFNLLDPEPFFAALPLAGADTLLDLACGAGAYTLELARRRPTATIHAIDLWAEGLVLLDQAAAAAGRDNIRTAQADAGRRLPLEDASIDLCLTATVLHDLVEVGNAAAALAEIHRVLRPGGTLAVVEFRKQEGPPGPPVAIRLAPEELTTLVAPHGFTAQPPRATGDCLYLMLFTRR